MSLEMKYFVLKPQGLTAHARASRHAMYAYAHEIMVDDEQLGVELLKWVEKEEQDADNA